MKFLLPMVIAAASAFDLLCMWLRKFDTDFEEGAYPPDGVIRWGTCRGYRRSEGYRYIHIRVLFVSQWRPDYSRDRLAWHIPVLARARGKWRVYWEPVA